MLSVIRYLGLLSNLKKKKKKDPLLLYLGNYVNSREKNSSYFSDIYQC